MSRDGGIEVLDGCAAALESGLDTAVRLADGIRPFGTWKFRAK
jgi:hypothetical protein